MNHITRGALAMASLCTLGMYMYARHKIEQEIEKKTKMINELCRFVNSLATPLSEDKVIGKVKAYTHQFPYILLRITRTDDSTHTTPSISVSVVHDNVSCMPMGSNPIGIRSDGDDTSPFTSLVSKLDHQNVAHTTIDLVSECDTQGGGVYREKSEQYSRPHRASHFVVASNILRHKLVILYALQL